MLPIVLCIYHPFCTVAHCSSMVCRFVSETTPQCLVDASKDAPVQCTIPIQEKFHLLVSSWPHSVTMRLYEAPRRALPLSLRSRSLLAEVPVAVPGSPGTLSTGSGVQGIEWACPTHASLPVSRKRQSGTDQEMAAEPVYPEGVIYNALNSYCSAGHEPQPDIVYAAGKAFVKCAWVPLPGVAKQETNDSGTMNSLFETSENVQDAIIVNMPLSPPHPHEAHGSKLQKFAGHQRMRFAQVPLCMHTVSALRSSPQAECCFFTCVPSAVAATHGVRCE